MLGPQGTIKSMSRRLLSAIAVVLLPCLARAESSLMPMPSEAAVLRYQQPFASLSTRERWQTRIHGLRFAPLDPRIWAPTRYDRTDNRTLIPIKRYVLRASEASEFSLQHLAVEFRFKPTSLPAMRRRPHQHDPVFEIGVGGEVQFSAGALLPIERFTIVRLSAFPDIPSGLCVEVDRHCTLQPSAAWPRLETGLKYNVEISCAEDTLEISLNGERLSSFRRQGLCHGLVSMQTGWHPLYIDELRIQALGTAGMPAVHVDAGLVPVGPNGGQR